MAHRCCDYRGNLLGLCLRLAASIVDKHEGFSVEAVAMKEEQAKAMHDIVEKLRYLASVDPQTRFCRECADIGIALEAIIASPSAGQWIAVTEMGDIQELLKMLAAEPCNTNRITGICLRCRAQDILDGLNAAPPLSDIKGD